MFDRFENHLRDGLVKDMALNGFEVRVIWMSDDNDDGDHIKVFWRQLESQGYCRIN